MTKQELANEKRLNNAVVASSMTLPAQLKAINHEAGYQLKLKDKNGTVTTTQVTKRDQLSKLGMEPKTTAKGAILGYTPATFQAGVDESLKEVIDGHVVANYCYVDRVVTVTIEDANTGSKDYSLYTSEEADKKVKGESAQTIKLYRRVLINETGWAPGLIVKVLYQSRHIAEEHERAVKSAEAFNAIEHFYIVKNVDGVLRKIEVNIQNSNAECEK